MSEHNFRVAPLPADLWLKDEPLRCAAELLDRLGDQVKAVSFDFFDTIVWRLVNRPTDLFSEMGARLAAGAALGQNILPADFITLRRHAEHKTRERQNSADARVEDIKISAIYETMSTVLKNPADAVKSEHATECECCCLNPGMIQFIEHVRQRGLKLIIVSDIYFSAEQLRDILRANKFDPAIFDLILTSADAGLCKGTGNLFKLALKTLGLSASEVVHLGDNYHPDVLGARRAGITGCHYPQASSELTTLLEREQILLGGHAGTFNANSLRLLAARYFPNDSVEGFFSRTGAMIMGPLMTRFATWACEQYVAAGVKKVGAFMREGHLFAEMLQREAALRGHDLDIQPLYLNRKATDLAALGKLSAANLIDWLERRCTLPISGILKHFGFSAAELRRLPLSLNEKADSKEKILKLAEYLFTPAIARRIEEKSAEERGKVMDYLRPWMESGDRLGVCDIGYSASAQAQLHRILQLENCKTKVTGCYLVTYEKAADRVLEGMDIRHFLGAYGKPDYYYRGFIRAPAFIEQALVAPTGTTLGYERQADGSVTPVLDRMPYDDEMLKRQKAFKAGILFFQSLWFSFQKTKPELLAGKSDFSRRVLADVDVACQPILARIVTFPTTAEVNHFGNLALDDYYFADKYKPLCSSKDREQLRQEGYGKILGQASVHWPQGTHALENPRSNAEFFSFAKAFIQSNPEHDGDAPGAKVDLTVFVRALRNPAVLRECLARISVAVQRGLRIDLVLAIGKSDAQLIAVAREFSTQFTRFRIGEMETRDNINRLMNGAADESPAPHILYLQEDSFLPPDWDKTFFATFQQAEVRTAAAIPILESSVGRFGEPTARAWLVRRTAFIEGLGFKEELSPNGAVWNLLLRLADLKWNVIACPDAVVEIKAPLKTGDIASADALVLKQSWLNYLDRIAGFSSITKINLVSASAAANPSASPIKVNWSGSFLDYGSLSHVNRACVAALKNQAGVEVSALASSRPTRVPASLQAFSKLLAPKTSKAEVTIRHQWPPDWRRPESGKLVVIQPWEFGSLPADWVNAAQNVNEFWVPSNYVRQVYISSGVSAAKVSVIPNGIDPGHFRPGLKPLPLATNKKFRFLFVGGTIRRKGPDVLLAAYLSAFTAADDVCLVIKDFGGDSVYQGQTFEKEIALARQRPDAPEILYLNEELSAEAMPGLYAACNCLVLPYRGEGFGLPVLEAMACALPVVVTRGGATDDFVSEKNGWLIPAERKSLGTKIGELPLAGNGWWLEPDAKKLSLLLKEIAANPAEAVARGLRGAELAHRDFTWATVAKKIHARLQILTRENVSAQPILKNLPGKITLPNAALKGHLAAARTAVAEKQFLFAWELTAAALQARPFHPEAWLLRAEIATAAGDVALARTCCERARTLTPDWKQVSLTAKSSQRRAAKLPVVFPALEPVDAAPRLSVCLIVKNEEQFLERCLQSIASVAHQIVIVDTGSTDRTLEIAKKFNAQIYQFTWTHDFSAARNIALEQATGDWVLSLDADEELPLEQVELLRQQMLSPKAIGYRLPIVDVGREQEGCSYVPRLFRNAPGIFFLGRVHEQVFSSLQVRATEWNLELQFGKCALRHYGYVEAVVKARDKVARNLHLLELALEELPGEPNLVMNQGLELIRSGELQAGLDKYREAVKLMTALPANQIVPELRETLLTQFATHLLRAKAYDEIAGLFAQPLARDAGLTASQHFLAGLAQMELKQPELVAESMRACLAKRHLPALSPVNAEIMKAGPHHCLALALAALDQPVEAEKAFQAALQIDLVSRNLRFDFARFKDQRGLAVEALTLLNEIVGRQPDDLPAWQFGGQIALSRPEFTEFAGNWTTEALKNFSDNPVLNLQRAEILLLTQETESALPLWLKYHSPQNARHLAAMKLCQFAENKTIKPIEGNQEAATSQELLKWYRQLIAHTANSLVVQINERLEEFNEVAPTFVSVLSAALKHAAPALTA